MNKSRKVLSDYNHPVILAIKERMDSQSKKTILKWALDYCYDVLLPILKKYSDDVIEVEEMLSLASKWDGKTVKLTQVKPFILDVHRLARSQENIVIYTALRAMAQACSAIHSVKHALGTVFYGALCVAYDKSASTDFNIVHPLALEECNHILERLELNSVKNE